nr:hypothetical protein [Bartonella sp. CM31XJBT]
MRESYVIRDSHSTYKTVNYHYKSMYCTIMERFFNTKIMEGGIQNLYVEEDLNDYSSFAFDTKVFSGGEQHILAGGIAIGVLLQGNAFQAIDLGGYVKDLIIRDQAQSWLHFGATLEGSTMIHDSGRIYLYAGAERSRTEVEKNCLKWQRYKIVCDCL